MHNQIEQTKNSEEKIESFCIKNLPCVKTPPLLFVFPSLIVQKQKRYTCMKAPHSSTTRCQILDSSPPHPSRTFFPQMHPIYPHSPFSPVLKRNAQRLCNRNGIPRENINGQEKKKVQKENRLPPDAKMPEPKHSQEEKKEREKMLCSHRPLTIIGPVPRPGILIISVRA